MKEWSSVQMRLMTFRCILSVQHQWVKGFLSEMKESYRTISHSLRYSLRCLDPRLVWTIWRHGKRHTRWSGWRQHTGKEPDPGCSGHLSSTGFPYMEITYPPIRCQPFIISKPVIRNLEFSHAINNAQTLFAYASYYCCPAQSNPK